MTFQKAIKRDARGRVALVGPAGAGKSFTMLTLARALAGPAGKVAAIDTEHGSLSKYGDLFDFDVMELNSFTPDNFMAGLKDAERAAYSVFCCDSLSHFWVGKDGALEFVDLAAKRHRDQMGGWKDFRPHERAMIDAMIASPCHVIVTMRTKTDYVEEVNPQGKKVRRKVGLAPVQREGLEYEMDMVGYMDEDNTLVIDKTRCPFYTQKAIAKPGEKEFAPFIEWLRGAPVELARQQPVPAQQRPPQEAPQAAKQPFQATDDDIPDNIGGAWVDPDPNHTQQKVEEMRQRAEQPRQLPADRPWSTFKGMIACFEQVKSALNSATGNDAAYYGDLDLFGVKHANGFRKSSDAISCYRGLQKKLAEVGAKKEAA